MEAKGTTTIVGMPVCTWIQDRRAIYKAFDEAIKKAVDGRSTGTFTLIVIPHLQEPEINGSSS